MTLNKKIVTRFLATTAFAFGIGGAGAAEPPGTGCENCGPGGEMRSGMQMMGDPAVRAEQRMAELQSQLKLTPKQDPLWSAFADKVKAGAAPGMNAMRDSMQKSMTAPERMTQMMAMMRERMTAMEAAADAFKRLYGTMSAEQKALVDRQPSILGGMMPPPPPGGPGGAPQGADPARR